MKSLFAAMACFTLALTSLTLAAADEPRHFTPAIEGYGGAVHLPDAAAQLDSAKDYKLVFNITQAGASDQAPLIGLATAARFLNLAALAEIPRENLFLVMAIHGRGTAHALSGERYRERFGTENPSLDLIDKLTAYGVKIYVCGQALASAGFAHDEVNPDIEVAVAALTILANYQLDGYALMSY